MSELETTNTWGIQRRDNTLEAELAGRPIIPRSVERAITNGVARQYGKAVVQAARVQATKHVANNAMRALAELESEEAAAAGRDPMNNGRRQRQLVDAAQACFVEAIQDTGRTWR